MNRDGDPNAHASASAAASRRRAAARAWPGWRRHWRWAAAIAGVFLLLLIAVRQPLADLLWPQTRAETLREEAASALQRGHLSAADGSGARELYEAALAMEPDRGEAREGLMRVALAALERARRATAENRFADAHAALRLARELSAPREGAAAAADALRRREAAHAGLDQLWERAQRAHEAGRLHGGADTALPLYRRILQLDPGNADVLRAREDAIAELLQQARAGLRQGELASAAAAVALAREFDPGHVDLPDTGARLAEERDAALSGAAADLEAGQLERAEQRYRQLLEIDPGAADARAGLDQVGVALAQRAARLAADFRFADADAALARASALAPDHPAVLEGARQVERARRLKAQLGPKLSPRERAARVRELLASAAAAEERGDLLTPPGESAYDRLRSARAIAPDDPGVRRAGERLLPVARECFERELRSNSLGRARTCFDVRVALADDVGDLALARRRLAQRWLAIGDERLGAGELAPARAAAAAARDIDPAVPGLTEFVQRLDRASARAE
ncbi:hypothetical protein H0E84_19245 [Luteimonas sp. SJ-92]|uniref:Tetratricopeptide repeat protein n=1 Tax=Luteimonas salinisoli TaxID=2752307 RepID=A0A853JIF4_9GAMM|nr:hypothetical protein [Luteimonas salinisoli]NZA28514.1 hypothetical protein [Luteimonas salinisoli]